MKQHLKKAQQSLEKKLNQLSEGGTISLTLDEATVYGVDQSDFLPAEEEVDDGR